MTTASNRVGWTTVLGLGLHLGGIALLGLTLWLVALGRPFAVPHVLYVEKPLPHLLGGLIAIAVGAALLPGGARGKRVASRCVLAAISVSLTLAALEFGLRQLHGKRMQTGAMTRLRKGVRPEPGPHGEKRPLALLIEPVPDDTLVYQLQSNLDIEFGHTRVHLNSGGMRDSGEYARERTPGTVRIVGLGDSGMFGWGVEQDEDYLSVLESNLNARTGGPKVEVLNFGTPGYNTQLEIELLKQKALAWSPDIVLFGWCVNDFDLPYFVRKQEDRLGWSLSWVNDLLAYRKRFQARWWGTELLDPHDVEMEKIASSLVSGAQVSAVRDQIGALQQLGEREKFKVLFVGPLRTNILAILKDQHIPYINTFEAFKPGSVPPEWCLHEIHPRKEGHRAIGEYLAKDLEQRGWLTPRP